MLDDLEDEASDLTYLYSNVSEIAGRYFFDDSADDVDNFEVPR